MPANLRRAEAKYADASPRGTLRLASTVEEAVREAGHSRRFRPRLESKLEISSMIDRMAPPKTFSVPRLLFSITDLASCVYRPDRCIAVRGDLTTNTRKYPPAPQPTPVNQCWPRQKTSCACQRCPPDDPDVLHTDEKLPMFPPNQQIRRFSTYGTDFLISA